MEVLPAVGPVVGDLGGADLDRALPGRGLDLAQLRQLALAAVDRVLDIARPALLLDAVRRQDGQLGEDEVGTCSEGTSPQGESRPASAVPGVNRRPGARG